MSEQPHIPHLFARIASEQDAALAARQAHDDLGRALVERISAQAARRPLRRALAGAGGLLALGGLAALVILGWDLRSRSLRFEVGATRVSGTTGAPIEAEAQSDLPLRFSDGSTVTFRPGSRGRVDRLGGGGAEILVQEGRLEAEVIHGQKTRWVVRAGPFAVRVTGTRFTVDWRASTGALAVDVRQGAVVVQGGVLGPGVPLRAGQRLSVTTREGHPPTVRSEPIAPPTPLAAPSHPPAGPPAPAAGAPRMAGRDGVARVPRSNRDSDQDAGDQWRLLAAQGAHEEALQAAQRQGLSSLRRRLDARGLLALGDVARFARAPEEARQSFEALVQRFPDDRLAGDAVFSLGRLAFEAGRPRQAAQWFARYVQKWPDGLLAEQAGGRLLEAARAGGDRALIDRAAAEYLRRHPDGPLAGLARASLADEESESPSP